jgi:hypothetical protein
VSVHLIGPDGEPIEPTAPFDIPQDVERGDLPGTRPDWSVVFWQAKAIHEFADQMLTESIDHLSVEQAIRASDECRKARAALAAIEEFLAKRIGILWDGAWKDKLTVEGVGQVQPYRPAKDKWDDEGVVHELVQKRIEETGGEMPDPLAVARWLLDAGAVSYWRVGVLKELGIDVADYRHREYGTVRLKIEEGSDRHMPGDTVRNET